MASLHHPSGWGAPLTVGPGFRGRLSNVDVAEDSSVSHINIDKSARIQAEIAGEIGAVAKTKFAPDAKRGWHIFSAWYFGHTRPENRLRSC
jgi:hypothetical protein